MIDINMLTAHLDTVSKYRQTVLKGSFSGADSYIVASMVNYFNDVERQLTEQIKELSTQPQSEAKTE